MNATIKPFPSRLVPSGTVTIAATSGIVYAGQNARQDRRQIIITNLSSTLDLKLRTPNGVPFMTVFPRTALTLETQADIEVYNPNGSSVAHEVGEIFYDDGTQALRERAEESLAGVNGGSSRGGIASGSPGSWGGGGFAGTSGGRHTP